VRRGKGCRHRHRSGGRPPASRDALRRGRHSAAQRTCARRTRRPTRQVVRSMRTRMQTATSETESKSRDLSICVHHYTLRAPCPKGQGIRHNRHPLRSAAAVGCICAASHVTCPIACTVGLRPCTWKILYLLEYNWIQADTSIDFLYGSGAFRTKFLYGACTTLARSAPNRCMSLARCRADCLYLVARRSYRRYMQLV